MRIEKNQTLLYELVGSATDGPCIDWPNGRFTSGYGQVKINGKTRRAHRVALEYKLGRAIHPDLCALHSCDNRICINPFHLREGTLKENTADMFARGRANKLWGEKHPSAKLTEAQAREIKRRTMAGATHQSVADFFGISRETVGRIYRGVSWPHL